MDIVGEGAGDVINNYGVSWDDEDPLPPQELAWGDITGDIEDQDDLATVLNGKAGKATVTFVVDTTEQLVTKTAAAGNTAIVKTTGKLHTYDGEAWNAGVNGEYGVIYIGENEQYVWDTTKFVLVSTEDAKTLNGKSEEHFAAKTDIPSLTPYRTSEAQDIIDAGKQDKPATSGTAGQVLGLDENGLPIWITPQGGDYIPMPRVTTIPADGNYLPGTLYVLTLDGTERTINLVSGESGKTAEYHIILSIGATAPTITWPTGLTWADGTAPTIESSHVYELNILEGRAFCKDWGAA